MDEYYLIISNLTFITPLILLIGIVLNATNFRIFHGYQKVLYLLLFFSLIIDLLSRYLGWIIDNNLFIYIFSSLIEFILIFTYFVKVNLFKSKINIYLFLILLMFNFYELYTSNYIDSKYFQCYSITLNSIFLLVLVLKNIFKNIFEENYKIGIELSLFIFLAINSLVNLPLNLLVNYEIQETYIIWLVKWINYIFFYSSTIYYLWNHGKNQKRLLAGF